MSVFSQSLKVKTFNIDSGKVICILNELDAKELGVFAGDRVEIKNKQTGKNSVAIVDVTSSMVPENSIGLFNETKDLLGVKSNQLVDVSATSMIKSVDYIKKKMRGEKLSKEELKEIVKDISENRLSDIEASAFMSAVYMKGFDLEETANMTKALIENGRRISFDVSPVVDKHSVGGVNGRATMIIVPIVISEGLYMPKTSSRSITSAAGTADAMEVLAPVDISFEKIKKITKDVGGVISWGGSVDLAPADDKIVQIEHPLALDPEGQVIASVLAKKASVGSKFVVIDLPVGIEAKIQDRKTAMRMARKFVEIGKEVGMEVEAVITNGNEPNGLAFGSALEAKYALEVLEGKRFDNLAKKSCELAGAIFELAGLSGNGKGYDKAVDILKSGRALQKMKGIIKAQGGKINSSTKVILSPMNTVFKAEEDGVIQDLNVKGFTKIARLAGAPANKLAGVLLHKEEGDKIKKGEPVYTIFAEHKVKLASAVNYAKGTPPFVLKSIVISTVR
jgi:AMP phosphorylase